MSGRLIQLPNGRSLGVSGLGDALARRVVVFCHPSPGAGSFDPDPTVTAHWGVRVVGIDRPGYGASEPWLASERPSFAAHADDIAYYLSEIESSTTRLEDATVGPFGVVGWGDGGYTALALASRHPRLVDRVALVDMPSPHRRTRRPPLAPPFRIDDLGVGPQVPGFDASALGRRVTRMLTGAGTQGNAGVRGDDAALDDSGWMARLGEITADVKLIYGDAHPTLSTAIDGRRLRRRIPRATTVRVEGGDGFSIATHWPSILQHLAPHHGGVAKHLRA